MQTLTNLIRKEERLLNKILPGYSKVYDGVNGDYWCNAGNYSRRAKGYFNHFLLASLDCLSPTKEREHWLIDRNLTQTKGLIEHLRKKAYKRNNKNLLLFGAKISRDKANVGFLPPHSVDVTQLLTEEDSAPEEIARILNNLAIELCLEEGSTTGFMNAVYYIQDIELTNKRKETWTELYKLYNNLYEKRKSVLGENLKQRLFCFDYFISLRLNNYNNLSEEKYEQLKEKYGLKNREIIGIRGPDLKEFTGPMPEEYTNNFRL